ncbi:unnamed protein product [Candida verbasci]|uniref:Large ribosomal subunit protein uL30m n=1 Tax=Candida verbasci TaxID=1227364 RepID=A0A9W4XAN1_9ASCO|nr:unnamed protein product [Candida verbasci]
MSTSIPKQQFYKITQIRSTIGVPPKQRGILQSLGFSRRNQIKFHPINESNAIKLLLVKELIKVEVSNEKLSNYEINQMRRIPIGSEFEIIKNGMRREC